MEKNCLNCKFYKVEEEFSGYCRKKSSEDAEGKKIFQMTRADDVCEMWVSGGQQYYIRKGWIEARKKKKLDEADDTK